MVPVPNVHARRFDDELIILDLNRGFYFGLNGVGAAIWEGLAQGKALSDVVRALADEYDATEAQLMEDAKTLVDQLVDAGLAAFTSGNG
jgi:hypothetical protein